MTVPSSIITKVATAISKKTKLSPELVTTIITIGIPILWGMYQKNKAKKARSKASAIKK